MFVEWNDVRLLARILDKV